MIYLTNAFSIHMLPQMKCGEWESVRFRKLSFNEARELLRDKNFRSFFGHVDTVHILESCWRMKIPVNRGQVSFRKGDVMVIATIASKREWEQCKNPRGAKFEFFLAEYV